MNSASEVRQENEIFAENKTFGLLLGWVTQWTKICYSFQSWCCFFCSKVHCSYRLRPNIRLQYFSGDHHLLFGVNGSKSYYEDCVVFRNEFIERYVFGQTLSTYLLIRSSDIVTRTMCNIERQTPIFHWIFINPHYAFAMNQCCTDIYNIKTLPFKFSSCEPNDSINTCCFRYQISIMPRKSL